MPVRNRKPPGMEFGSLCIRNNHETGGNKMQLSRFQCEKRDFRRLEMNCPVSYQSTNSGNSQTGTCLNLSASGILIECDDKFPVGTTLNISVSPKLAISPSFTAIVEVIRVIAGSSRGCYQIAGKLADIH